MSPSRVSRTWAWLKELSFTVAIILALVIYIESTKGETIATFRAEVNSAVALLCERGTTQSTIKKYNDLIDTLIEDYGNRKAENEARRDFEKASINSTTLGKLSLSKVEIPKQNCNRPFLPGR